jgi:hypothetical protein
MSNYPASPANGREVPLPENTATSATAETASVPASPPLAPTSTLPNNGRTAQEAATPGAAPANPAPPHPAAPPPSPRRASPPSHPDPQLVRPLPPQHEITPYTPMPASPSARYRLPPIHFPDLSGSDITAIMLRRLYWLIVVPIYFAAVVFLLWRAYPVFVDTGGPVPGFWWGESPPLPNFGEYIRHQHDYNWIYLRPYIVAAIILTAFGCWIAPLLVRRMRVLSSRPFLGSAAVTLLLAVFALLVSDLGVLLRLWFGPVALLHRYENPLWGVIHFSKMLMPACLLSGLAALGEGAIINHTRAGHP